jgi:SAM-dependent methyltransferase
MKSTSLRDSNLGVTAAEIDELFAPFVAKHLTAGDPEWRAELGRRQRKILVNYLKRVFMGWMPATQRHEGAVIEEYSKAWEDSEYASYSLEEPPCRISPWEWHEQKMFASDVGATRFRQLLLIRLIEKLQPRSVLEVGCGNGINLMLLACRFPDIDFNGVELTEEGYRSATDFQTHARLPEPMEKYAPLPLPDPTAFRRVKFVQGNAADLAYEDGAMDLVMTILALEQMERIRGQALREISRVAARHLLNIEPFRDVNGSGWPRRNVIRYNYFRGRIADLADYGMRPTLVLDDFPQETFLKACLVLSEKLPA